MNILICDDIPVETEKLSALLNELGHTTVAYSRAADALAYIRSGAAADVCILDIIMPEMSGIELAQNLRKDGFSGEVVFLSASNEYGPQTYEVKAFNYLLKPLSPENVRRVIDDIRSAREMNDKSGLTIKISGAVRFIPFRDIEYAEVIRHYVTIRLTSAGPLEIRIAFTEITPQLLCDSRFIQCHQSYIVNMDAITSMTSREIIMACGARIPVSKSYPDTKLRYLNRGLRGVEIQV